jgi:aspartate 1-decarboxylase
MSHDFSIILDGKPVEKITAFLFSKGGNENPHVLLANADKSFQGSIVLGMGFTFDDTNPDATSIAEMQRLIEVNPKNAERISPYIGGEEVNSNPTHVHHRYVINFGELSEEEARQWPELMAIVEEKVKPQRLAQKREIRARYWWRFGETTPALFNVRSGVGLLHCQQVSFICFSPCKHGLFAQT